MTNLYEVSHHPVLCIVIPCYNEQDVLPETSRLFECKINQLISENKISVKSYILLVNDGSKDATWEIITKLSEQNHLFHGISLSRNRGHQNAVLAGLMEAKNTCDITISIDCDGQDDINAMDEMIEQYLSGSDIVYGVRNNRNSDTFFKRSTAECFYKLMRKLGVETVYNHADYRLVSKRVLNAFFEFKEVNIFLRGMFPLVGFKSSCVYYSRKERIAGKSHYPLRKMLSFAFEGITSLSVKPLHIIVALGCFVAFLSFCGVICSVAMSVFGKTVVGWASTASIICFIGGIQLVCTGIIGEYVGKIYMEVKHRPRFIISERAEDFKGNGKNE